MLASASRSTPRRCAGVAGGLRPLVPRHLLADRDRLRSWSPTCPACRSSPARMGKPVPGHHRHGGRPEDRRADHRGRARRA
ncbi:MAG: hypothetical protein MZW92_10025 [Comamonadaceae bacterium]|nr:hypothetical protein [Comamonadaceae bacterium]